MKTGVRGTTTVAAAYFYAPYIPLSMMGLAKPSKYNFSRARWYFADLSTAFDLDRIKESWVWCTEHFGPLPKQQDAWTRWYHVGASFKFRDEKDYVLFMLRWS